MNYHRPECGEGGYLGVDFKWHKFPVKEVMNEKNVYESKQAVLIPLLVSLTFIVGAYFYRKNDRE